LPQDGGGKLDTQNVKMIQRYVAMNELRCLLVEARVVRGWEWNVMIGKSKRFLPPMGVATVQSPKGLLNFLVERPQMSQNFIGYLKTKLEQYRTLYEKQGGFVLNHIESHNSVIVLFTSTLSMAERIHEEVKTHLFPFTIWFAVDDDRHTLIQVDEWFDRKLLPLRMEAGTEIAFCDVREGFILGLRNVLNDLLLDLLMNTSLFHAPLSNLIANEGEFQSVLALAPSKKIQSTDEVHELKSIKITEKRQFTIPKSYFERLNMGRTVKVFLLDGGIFIKPHDEDDKVQVNMEKVLKEVVDEGYEGEEIVREHSFRIAESVPV
jgi:bifunctional DNA-binding transcriptional regulator/antitoxin component of YhaV-PrlF toxin-antitoxin module